MANVTPEDRDMPRDLALALAEHSPRVFIRRATLIRTSNSDTGWVLVIPTEDDGG